MSEAEMGTHCCGDTLDRAIPQRHTRNTLTEDRAIPQRHTRKTLTEDRAYFRDTLGRLTKDRHTLGRH